MHHAPRTFTRRSFVSGILLLPLLKLAPAQYGGAVEYNCDIGESAYGYWYVGDAATLIVDWHYLDRSEFKVERGIFVATEPTPVSSFFWSPDYWDRVRRVVWFCTGPAYFAEGSCI